MRCRARFGLAQTGGPRATAMHAACRGGLDRRLGAGHGEERTRNIWYMVVTLELFQLEMSASKFFKL